jgi:hypothetical protein
MKIKYKNWSPKIETLNLVNVAESIIAEYESAGYVLTLRQLYYQFVARGLVENSERSYKNIGNTITKARMAGMISWKAIEDRNRGHESFWYEEDECTPVQELPYYIRFDQWLRQDYYIEVWVEKEALGNVIKRACDPYLVPYMSCKGYLSASEAWRAGMRFKEKMGKGKKCVLLHLGDHDPSGIDMTRDNKDRLDIFTEAFSGVSVKRLALNMDQVDQYKPPPNPTKVTDSRANEYIKKFGSTSWELDALEPQVIETLIKDEIYKYIDQDRWDRVRELQKEKRALLAKLYDNWGIVQELLDNL